MLFMQFSIQLFLQLSFTNRPHPHTCTHIQTCPREEETAELVEGYGHDSIRQIECLLDAIAMVNVNIYI